MFECKAEYVIASFRKDVVVEQQDDFTLAVKLPDRRFVFRRISSGIGHALTSLRSGASLASLSTSLLSAEGPIGLATLLHYLRQFDELGMITRTIVRGSVQYVTSVRIGRIGQHDTQPVYSGGSYEMSRFAFVRQSDGNLYLESPVSHRQFVIHHEHMLSWWAQFRSPMTFGEALAANEFLRKEETEVLLQWLIEEWFLTPSFSDGTGEMTNPALAQWEFHDLLFHSRSRDGRHSNRYGGSYPWLGWVKSLPAVKPNPHEQSIDLTTPDEEGTPEVFQVLERRRSIREYSARPITLSQVSHFLYRSARILEQVDGDDEITRRPYPSGGARYPLELYVISFKCDGLPPGAYHYDPRAHSLATVETPELLRERIVSDLRVYTSRAAEWCPQVAIVITARFQRVSWKYQSVAYSLILKEVGALMQTMYFVATAMGLAPCAVGGGDSDLFSNVIGEDYYRESAVGEFLLGSCHQEP